MHDTYLEEKLAGTILAGSLERLGALLPGWEPKVSVSSS
jgi:hypothetical protein